MEIASDMRRGLHFLLIKNWNLALLPEVATIRSEVVKFLTNAQLNVIMGVRTLDEVRGKMEDPPTLGRQRTSQYEKYDSWPRYISSMKKPDKYAETLFVIDFKAHI